MKDYSKRITSTSEWKVSASNMAKNTFNPIRNILETMDLAPNPEKEMISLSIGDPTVFGNLKPAQEVIDAVTESVQSGKNNGYGPSTGFLPARKAVAEHVATPGSPIDEKDVILCSGCSCALDLCISALGNPGQNILVPRPGFPLYATLAKGLGIETKEYDLIPEKNWEIDLAHMEAQIDQNTVAILINNPSNPCGSVFNKEHLKKILAIAEKNRLPIIADEIYDYFVFPGHEYIPIASLTTSVPVLSCGGLTKRFLVPGWRMGWITIHDRNQIFAPEVRKGLQCLSQRIIGSNTLVQGALPAILKNTPKSFFDDTINIIESNAKIAYSKLVKIPGLKPVMPSGAMYMMVGIERSLFPEFENDLEIVEAMVKEQSVFCLPGKCFNIQYYVRIVLTVPGEKMHEACERIAQFCYKHVKYSKGHLPCLSMAMSEGSAASSSELSSSNSSDEEDIHHRTNSNQILAPPIAYLVNRSLASGIVPTGFKTGHVIPIHKGKGKRSDLEVHLT
eukprot:maker-scaffold322_size207131-snap-gene-1.15 protein:Tk09478 transcript:maker-scaffold322_size207131-snap-gene-1.15-mRNA-1 annotation:"tyrosine aminotransferase"